MIKNETLIGNDSIDLSNITMPILNIVGKKDDLVRPHSSKSTLDAIESKDKKLIEFPTGHVGLCISKQADPICLDLCLRYKAWIIMHCPLFKATNRIMFDRSGS